MAQRRQLIILSLFAFVFLIILSTCHSYPLFNELTIPQRPTKFYSNDADRHVNRMKQYYETMAQLRHWRRDIDLSNEDSDDILQNIYRQYKDFDYQR